MFEDDVTNQRIKAFRQMTSEEKIQKLSQLYRSAWALRTAAIGKSTAAKSAEEVIEQPREKMRTA